MEELDSFYVLKIMIYSSRYLYAKEHCSKDKESGAITTKVFKAY